jgi:diadenosine tetraphosphate (Ap4A) HIT family hydrolase
MIKSILFAVARRPAAALMMGHFFAHLSFLLPVPKLYADRRVVVFHHPAPSWDVHVLAVPKSKTRSLIDLDLTDSSDREIALSLYQSLAVVAARLKCQQYSLILNGGAYQDVPQLHIHLTGANTGLDCLLSSNEMVEYNRVVGYAQNDLRHPFHWHITTLLPHPAVQDLNLQEHGDALLDMLAFAQHLVQTSQLPAYRLILQSSDPQFGYHLIH